MLIKGLAQITYNHGSLMNHTGNFFGIKITFAQIGISNEGIQKVIPVLSAYFSPGDLRIYPPVLFKIRIFS